MRKQLLIGAVLSIIAGTVYAVFFTGSPYSEFDHFCVHAGIKGHAVGVTEEGDIRCQYDVLAPIES
ncbi:hypothetical protein GW943_01130 [Candidatus Parcubacteria bacterium]|uniref:Uncharacterized protein n=1 Tax=Candidatus Kaiserbacteria bacterium CG10_big_fil_rev_8_21_14_0_10_47_16 TaxID=1974608 RepID=A0A2H0UDK1_9BACT|nr:hypothetical protein [Candidatus Parcubacteria bacterium]PIR84430.1 MAG: hypothetical protein COU16_02510 [Candidatus Kaiserbacteria bacterium CG10_big_fil_rev_8_21_14_0_10_47_16]